MRVVARLVNGEISEEEILRGFNEILSELTISSYNDEIELFITTREIKYYIKFDEDGIILEIELCNWIKYGDTSRDITSIIEITGLIRLVQKYIFQHDDLVGLLLRLENITKDITQEELDAICNMGNIKSANTL